MKKNTLLLAIFYILAMTLIILIYWLDLNYDLVLYTCLFMTFIYINRISLNFIKKRSKVEKIIYITEACFVIYVIFLFVYGDRYFTLYRLLAIPSLMLGIYQSFMLEKVKKEK